MLGIKPWIIKHNLVMIPTVLHWLLYWYSLLYLIFHFVSYLF